MSALADLQYLANIYNNICNQESLLSSSSTFNIPGFHAIRSDVIAPGVRSLCSLIRSNFFSVVDCSALLYSSLEIIGVILHCFLDAPSLILNFYRYPTTNIPFSVYSNLFAMGSTFKYAMLVEDFNAHHHA